MYKVWGVFEKKRNGILPHKYLAKYITMKNVTYFNTDSFWALVF